MAREITCPSCQQTLRVRDGYTGSSMTCPSCSAKVLIPGAEAVQSAAPAPVVAGAQGIQEVQPAPRPRAPGKTMPCPSCGKDIARDARKCPHCREWLDEGDELPEVSIYKPCPRCGAQESQRVVWTFWGSFYGPSMFTHVRCPRCGYAYNGKTGGSNLIPAILFVAIPLFGIIVIVGGLILWLFYTMTRY